MISPISGISGIFSMPPNGQYSAAFAKAHRFTRSLFDCVCRVIVKKKRSAEDGSVRFEDEVLFDGIPCRISYEAISPAKKSSRQERINFTRKNDTLAAEIAATVKLFVPADVDIPPGSEVIVSKVGREFSFVCSGIAAVYSGHREIVMIPRGEFA
ncbi:MAG: hypothetical protein K2N56_05420 [Oscillospiraceae bacterium]|nr:hypothetical protein [Oscillospiraceae bacterium]